MYSLQAIHHDEVDVFYQNVLTTLNPHGGVDKKSFRCSEKTCNTPDMTLTHFLTHLTNVHFEEELFKELQSLQVTPLFLLL